MDKRMRLHSSCHSVAGPHVLEIRLVYVPVANAGHGTAISLPSG